MRPGYVGGVGRQCKRCGADSWTRRSGDLQRICTPCARRRTREWYARRKRKDPREAMLRAAKLRARKRGVDFRITLDDIVVPKRCPVLGIPLKVSARRSSAGSPSLDRLDPSKGYTPENVRVMSHRANQLKSDGTLQEHIKIAAWLRKEMKT